MADCERQRKMKEKENLFERERERERERENLISETSDSVEDDVVITSLVLNACT